jgi:hypothetical protein
LYQPNGADPSVLLRDLGTAFRGEALSYKPYPCGRPLHAAIDAALAARADGANLTASLDRSMRRGGFVKHEARCHRQDAPRRRGPRGNVGLRPLATLPGPVGINPTSEVRAGRCWCRRDRPALAAASRADSATAQLV